MAQFINVQNRRYNLDLIKTWKSYAPGEYTIAVTRGASPMGVKVEHFAAISRDEERWIDTWANTDNVVTFHYVGEDHARFLYGEEARDFTYQADDAAVRF